MSQNPVPPRYPPKSPYPTQAPQGGPNSMPAPTLQPPPTQAYPNTGTQGYLIDAPGQPVAPPQFPQPGQFPQHQQPLQPVSYFTPTAASPGGVWSYGKILVMHRQAQLPPVCVKCCAPADGKPLKRNVTWHPSWVYLLILPGLLIYAIVAIAIQEKATIYLGLCQRHRAKRRMHMLIAWGLFAAAIACFVAPAFLGGGRSNDDLIGTLVLIGLGLLLLSLIWAVYVSQMLVTPHKIDPQYVWLKGTSPEYVAQFPPMMTGPPA